MKNLTLVLFIFLAAAIHPSFAQSRYIVLKDSSDNEGKFLVGIIEKNDLLSDTSFHWYAESQRIYPRPDTAAVNAFRNNIDKISFIIFGGTWCEDTQFILPKFFRIQEAAAFPESRITVFGLDKHKVTIGNIAQAMNITNTPTIVVMKGGREIGRVVEYGKTGKWEQELADIINK